MKESLFYRAARAVMRVVVFLYTPYVLRIPEALPEGKVIVCCNHLFLGDPVYLAAAHKRQIRFMAKKELFGSRFFGWILKKLGAFPVERGTGDREALGAAGQILSDGGVLGIFLEGTRSKTGALGRPKNGAAMLAYTCQAPILPMCITARNGGKIRPFSKVVVSAGKLMTPDELGLKDGTGAEFRRASRMVMDQIAALRERDLHAFDKRKPCSILPE